MAEINQQGDASFGQAALTMGIERTTMKGILIQQRAKATPPSFTLPQGTA